MDDVGKDKADRRGGLFSKSGHTSHQARQPTPPSADPPPARPAPEPRSRTGGYWPSEYPPAGYPPQGSYPPWDEPEYRGRYSPRDAYSDRGSVAPPAHRYEQHDPYQQRTGYEPIGRDDERDPHGAAPAAAGSASAAAGVSPPAPKAATTPGGAAKLIGMSAVTGTNKVARNVTRKVITASKADGADASGLTALIWNQVLSYGTDAMITVALAGTVFFGASAHAQRGNVLLYLLITMAPFALIAPVIGPALDRLQHGRRWTMAATAIGRAVLALIMAANSSELLVLYPCALGSLVLSKAYGVVRAAAAPRLVPQGMTLTHANARLTMFGLGSTIILGGFVGIVIKVSGSYTAGLVVSAIGFATCAFFAFRLPKQVDSGQPAPRHPQEPARPRKQEHVPPMYRLRSWASRGLDPHLVIALQGESVLRLLSGLLTIYLAFYVESTQHGWTAAFQLALVIGAAGLGNFAGTAIGTRLQVTKPELIIVVSTCIAGAACVLIALAFNIVLAALGVLISAIANALSKIALDALIQRDVVETLRSSAFARSETFLQLAWVLGAAIGVALPSMTEDEGAIAFVVAGVIVSAVGALVLLRYRAVTRAAAAQDGHDPQGPRGRPRSAY